MISDAGEYLQTMIDSEAGESGSAAEGVPAMVLVDEKAPNCPMEQLLSNLALTTTECWQAKHWVSQRQELHGAGG